MLATTKRAPHRFSLYLTVVAAERIGYDLKVYIVEYRSYFHACFTSFKTDMGHSDLVPANL